MRAHIYFNPDSVANMHENLVCDLAALQEPCMCVFGRGCLSSCLYLTLWMCVHVYVRVCVSVSMSMLLIPCLALSTNIWREKVNCCKCKYMHVYGSALGL